MPYFIVGLPSRLAFVGSYCLCLYTFMPTDGSILPHLCRPLQAAILECTVSITRHDRRRLTFRGEWCHILLSGPLLRWPLWGEIRKGMAAAAEKASAAFDRASEVFPGKMNCFSFPEPQFIIIRKSSVKKWGKSFSGLGANGSYTLS